MKMTNLQIYNRGVALRTFIADNVNLKLPIKINFFLQRNIAQIMDAGTEIEQYRTNIGQKYGSLNASETGYDISPENMVLAQQELDELMSIEQDIPISLLSLEDFGNIEITTGEMAALLFMIAEPNEKGE